MPSVKNQSFDPNFSRALDIESLISAPLVAVSKANVTMAQGQTRFLLEYCFNKVGDKYEPVMIQMALIKGVVVPEVPAVARVEPSAPGVLPIVKGVDAKPAIPSSIQSVTTYFNIPLLTIIPLNSLAVEKVSIDFDMEITSVTAHPSDTANESGNKITDKKAQLYGKVSYDPSDNNNPSNQNNSKLSNKIKVNVNAGTLPLPSGILTIIDLYTKAIQPSQTEN